jgi:outer membrane protein assembly factor BamE (lipoprotein component of BamABCDE complex)
VAITEQPSRQPGRRKTAGAAVALGLIVASCTPIVQTHGYRLDPELLAQVEPHQTTSEQVLQLLGSPSSVATFDRSTWYYITQRTERMSFYQDEVVAQDVVAIRFNDQGTVEEVGFRGIDDAKEVVLVERETPTSGSELSAIEQFIGNIGRFNLPRDEREQR